MKILPVGAVVPRERTHTTKHTVTFRNLRKSLKNSPPGYPFLVKKKKRKPLFFVETATYSRIKDYLKELNVSRRINNICHL